jgi:hypothetical protein
VGLRAYWNARYTKLFWYREEMCSLFNTVINHRIQETEILGRQIKSSCPLRKRLLKVVCKTDGPN